jgi:protein CpxP
MKRAFGTYLALAALLTAGSLAIAQGPPDGRMGQDPGPGFGMHRPPMEDALGPRGAHGRWWNDPALVEKLKLTDEQQKAMDAILLEHREKLIDLRASVEKAELAMEPLMQDEHPNEGQILAQIDKVAQARAELEKANARFLLAIRSKLSPDQWKQLREDRADRMQRRMQDRLRDGGPSRRNGPPTPQGAGGPGPQGMMDPLGLLPPPPAPAGVGDR